jgi:hypothetical protein
LGSVARKDDPPADAVDTFTSETNTLFVVSSGDGTSGVAGSALTVASNGYRLDGAALVPPQASANSAHHSMAASVGAV